MTTSETPRRQRPPAFPAATADALRNAPAVARGREAASAAAEARADAATFAELVQVLHAEVIDARALLEAGRWGEARANLDRVIDGLDRLVIGGASGSDTSEKAD
jgi:hypothetical protein